VDIQALRALAVASVLLYHLWPKWLPGGYVGVDVFFVISGFLISSHLLARRPTSAGDLLRFWSARIRRLLPAALLVLLATLVATRLLAPDVLWASTATYVRIAALYGLNWRMAHDSVDYLATNGAPTPVQHFWSLSVEEQFYLVWPILIALLVLAARRHAWAAATVGLSAVTIASLWYSIHETASNPSVAYFITPTRVWELGVGGVLAALLARTEARRLHLPLAARTLLVWAGLAAVAWTLVAFSDDTSFPSWRAAVPVLGATAVIAADAGRGPGSPIAAMSWRPVQWLGDASYSIYLWHWPLLVLLPYKSGGHLGRLDKAAILVVTLALAAVTKRWVEDPFRRPVWGRPLLKPYAMGVAAMGVIVGASLLQSGVADRHQEHAAQAHPHIAAAAFCFGAADLDSTHHCEPDSEAGLITPDPSAASSDGAFLWKPWSKPGDCLSPLPALPLVNCHTESTKATKTVALVGNSHAAQWGPAVAEIATTRQWRIDTYFAHWCPSVLMSHADPAASGCVGWVARVADTLLTTKPDLVVISNTTLASVERMAGLGKLSYEANVTAFARLLSKLTQAGLHVLVIRDTPSSANADAETTVPACVAAHRSTPAVCAGSRRTWLAKDPAVAAAERVQSRLVTVADMTTYFCSASRCSGVIGGVLVYSDSSHLTATYARTVAPYLTPAVLRAMG